MSFTKGSRFPRGVVICMIIILLIGSIYHFQEKEVLQIPDIPKDLLAFGENVQPGSEPPKSFESAPAATPQNDAMVETTKGLGAGLEPDPSGASAVQPPTIPSSPSSPPQHETKPETSSTSSTSSSTEASFHEIALKHGTDKVTTHSYHHMYTKYLTPMRNKPLKMLEIGLGCDMNYGPGASYYTWLEFLPNVDLYYMEYDAACAAKWATKTTGATIVAGDQANITFLTDFKQTYGGDFDVIIDDGGHTMKQQIISLDWLFDAVKPGGLYFIEDLQTSYMHAYGGQEGNPNTMMEQIKSSLDDLILSRPRTLVMGEIFGIDCMREVCAFSKKEKGVSY